MNINRHNYEECFILYMDNELDSNGRRQVEAFVQNNPDLKEELDILLQYKLVPDTDIVFAGKEELMMPVPIGITGDFPVNLTNYEEWLVLYIDNELTIDQKIAVEQFISSHSSVQEELALLQRTKLQPETIHFAHKESLYRREEKVHPLPFSWWRVAAAAVLIIAVSLTAVIVLNKRSPADKPELVKVPANEQQINTPAPIETVKEKNTPVTIPEIADNRKQDLPVASKQANNSIVVKNNTRNEKTTNKIQAPVRKEEQVAVNNNDKKPSNNLPKPENNSTLNNNTPKNDVAINIPKEIAKPNSDENVTTDLPGPSYVKSTDDDVDLNQSEKKGKLRGFLRKVTRTFEKRTNIEATDDDKLLVGGLALRLK